jgi:hypothetical protein
VPLEIRFKPNHKKIMQAILYCVKENGGRINQYNLNKIIFSADKYHLNHYGRPVTGDTHIKMEYGVVPSAVNDIVKMNPIYAHANGIKKYPFTRDADYVVSDAAPELEQFSDSDIEALKFGIQEYGGLVFATVHDKNHLEHCWLETPDNKPIDFRLMIENEEVLKMLEENGSDVVI